MEKKKILITGFPHTGTSILKSKMGECSNVFEVLHECDFLNQETIRNSGDKDFILIKSPVLPLEIRKHGLSTGYYKDYYKILVNRNPWNLFTSLIKRGIDPLSGCKNHLDFNYYHTVEEYFVFCRIFLEAEKDKHSDVFAVRYENFFHKDGESLKKIMINIGLEFEDDIFRKKTKKYTINSKCEVPNERPVDLSNNELYRNWQINQPFQNMNSEVDIPEELNKILSESPIIKELGYTDPRLK